MTITEKELVPVAWRWRLRHPNEAWQFEDGTAHTEFYNPGDMQLEPLYGPDAAAALSEERKRADAAEAERDDALADRNELHATVRKLNCDNADEFWAAIGRIRARAETAKARADAAEATVERLRAALPFEPAVNDELIGQWSQGVGFAAIHPILGKLAREVEHYRAARAALQESTDG